MIDRGIITSFLLLGLAGCIKGTTIGMKLLIMAGAGLAGMYMMHLLAQDYNKYQSLNRPGRSIPDSHHFVKRSIHSDVTHIADFPFAHDETTTTHKTILEDIKKSEEYFKRNELISLERILQFDPTGCARRYVCTIAAKSSKKLSPSEKNIIQMLRNLPKRRKIDSGEAAFKFALDLGRRTKDAEACAEEYPKCIFTISQMLKLVGFT